MTIKNYIFLNPTINSYKIASQLKEYGKNIYFFNTKEFPNIKPNEVCSIYNSSYNFFTSNEGVSLKDDLCLLTEKNIKNKILLKLLKRSLRNINNSIVCGDITDLLLHKRRVLLNSRINIDIKTIDSFLDVKPTSEDLIVCNKLPFVYVSKYINNYESLSIYETDIDTIETFGNVYYIFYIEDNKFELYIYNKFICIIHNINLKVDDI
ncbi:MAG: hypothetical protein SVN78_06860, partial [Deferribacterota bacterium]|nr:hypothetical protein [Deferribacterota bacterium]